MGIGLTNACNLACGHCYRPKGAVRHVTRAQVETLLSRFDVHSVNLGTGENILNPHLPDVLDLLFERGVRTSLTSNGLSLGELPESLLRALHDVEVSFDFATAAELDAFRGAGVFERATRAVARCRDLGQTVTLLAVMMRSNWDRLADVARLAATYGARLRVNVYQPVHEVGFMPTREQLWEGFRRLLRDTALVTCTEPVVAAAVAHALGDVPTPRAGGCGRAGVRLTPDLQLLPCVYWPASAGTLADLAAGGQGPILLGAEFAASRQVPRDCLDCPLLAVCRGGCASRRRLVGALDAVDPYCPRLKDGRLQPDPVETLDVTLGPSVDLLHAANVCTTIVEWAC